MISREAVDIERAAGRAPARSRSACRRSRARRRRCRRAGRGREAFRPAPRASRPGAARRTASPRCTSGEVLQQEMMARGVARGDRHDGHADPLRPVVEAEPAREEPIAEGDVEEIAATRARRRQRTGHDLAPEVEIAGGIGGDGRLALGAGRRVDRARAPGEAPPGGRTDTAREGRSCGRTGGSRDPRACGPWRRRVAPGETGRARRPSGWCLEVAEAAGARAAARGMVSASGFQINARAEAARETFARRSGGDAGRAPRAGSRGPDGRGWLACARSRTRREGARASFGSGRRSSCRPRAVT